MNKFNVILAVAVAFVAVASVASALGGHRGVPFDDEFEGPLVGHGRRPFHGPFHGEGFEGEFRHPRHGYRGGRGFRGKRGGRIGGLAGGVGIGAQQSSIDRFGAEQASGVFDENEGQRTGLRAGRQHLDAEGHEFDTNNVEGVSKHDVIDNDKLIVKESNKGRHDLDAFKSSNTRGKGGRLSAGQSGLAFDQASGRDTFAAGQESNVDAASAQQSAAGIGAAGGAASL